MTPLNYQDTLDELVWDHQNWYISPEAQTSDAWQANFAVNPDLAAKIENAKRNCALSIPLLSKYLNHKGDFFASGTFLADAQTSLMCNNPLQMIDIY